MNAPDFFCPEPGAVQRLLKYSWLDIGYEYEGLTDNERACLTREQFETLKADW